MVEFESNTSVLPDEFIAHRLGMIPLVSTNCDEGMKYTRVRGLLWASTTYWRLVQDCDCENGCALCMILLHLNVRCDTPGTTLEVTSNHLQMEALQEPWNPHGGSSGEELTKRGEGFGLPVSRSMLEVSDYCQSYSFLQVRGLKDHLSLLRL